MTEKKDNRLANLTLVVKMLEQDKTMQKLGLETESQLQKCIDACVKSIDSGSYPDVLIMPQSLFRKHRPW